MLRIFSSFTVVAFCLWLLPLGNFIKPSQEKTACGGGRAMHMCSMMGGEVKPQSSGKISFSNSSSVEKTTKSSQSSGGNDVAASAAASKTDSRISKNFQVEVILPTQNFLYIPTPVPKF